MKGVTTKADYKIYTCLGYKKDLNFQALGEIFDHAFHGAINPQYPAYRTYFVGQDTPPQNLMFDEYQIEAFQAYIQSPHKMAIIADQAHENTVIAIILYDTDE